MGVLRPVFHAFLITFAVSLAVVEQVHSLESPLNTSNASSEAKKEEYRTPLAGEACTINLLGKK